MTINEFGDAWKKAGAGVEFRCTCQGGYWMVRGFGRRMTGVDLESAIKALLSLVTAAGAPSEEPAK